MMKPNASGQYVLSPLDPDYDLVVARMNAITDLKRLILADPEKYGRDMEGILLPEVAQTMITPPTEREQVLESENAGLKKELDELRKMLK